MSVRKYMYFSLIKMFVQISFNFVYIFICVNLIIIFCSSFCNAVDAVQGLNPQNIYFPSSYCTSFFYRKINVKEVKILIYYVILIYYLSRYLNFPMTRAVRWSVGRSVGLSVGRSVCLLVGRSVIIFIKERDVPLPLSEHLFCCYRPDRHL